MADPLPPVVEAVLDVVEAIPPGRVMSYGQIGALVGVGPRRVGNVMSTYGALMPWWRVVRADGRPAAGHEERALEHFASERTALVAGGFRVDMSRARHCPT
ncbi:O(6)-alkylguanine repair protein YbaZ [Branchiibius hedensis]|uniref:Alkylated DNA nucleotide flippase Atl1, participates in nucleotide excision repair, Ada-like DNA-binding domain n=1 Tax=Branchiibius hedensis TaxID=672460 RepID=A0A2Y8ZLD5_9MICO|nr:MGMT family protein [Branchiibius hedensis]PWJ24333.1 O(6)-alkylguanine repair protein YbaZ [Branchiibius hedensis]SSA33150.1 Alkylated DNA nucleotide flippase Atl1, participates in nucleotide excision repair, Ada-like DNA-binding domain [Branchiibius hedensis]